MEIVRAFTNNSLHTNITIKGTQVDPLFRASDIGLILDLTNINRAIQYFDDSEKQLIVTNTNGGEQQISYLTEKGLYKILFKSNKPIAATFQNWICDVIKEIRLTGMYSLQKQLEEKDEETKKRLKEKDDELKEKDEETKRLLEETEQLKKTNLDIPSIYIYNVDSRIEPPELKIGYTLNVYKRIKPYKQVCKYGKLEYSQVIYSNNINTIENFIHCLLNDFKIQDEVFKLDLEEAKLIINHVINLLSTVQIKNASERHLKLKQMYDQDKIIIDNEPNPKISVNTISTQTDFEDENEILPTNTKIITEYETFIAENCIVRRDVETSSTDIIGQYRLWSRNTTKEQYHGFKAYLDTRFKQTRCKQQDKTQVVNGYSGIKLIEIVYKKTISPSFAEQFVFHSCVFSPNGKALTSSLKDNYIKWKQNIKLEITGKEDKELKEYLSNTNYVLHATIWAQQGNGQGYYGITLKSEIDHHKKTSSTGKPVEKREVGTNNLIKTWETIAKAAIDENICAAKMSRSIKANTIFNDDYYYCIGLK